ncbi:MAG: DUF4837 family protein [Prevotellaceae bacterium]|jgi:hypothetical protein|nr:DUF4837 family protein [Prevotellaceae bacterium]
MKRLLCISVIATVLMTVVSCGDSVNVPKPGATGKSGELLVIIENSHWDSELGDTIRSIFERPYPGLANPEKFYTLIPVANSSFLPVMQKHRNILLISVSSEFSETKLTIKHDFWATPQIVLNAVGANISAVAKVLSDKREYMINLYEQAELERQSKNVKIYSDTIIHRKIKERFDVDLHVPSGYYTIMRNDAGFIWLETQSNHNSIGVFVYSYPFVDDSTFTVNYLMNKRDSIMKEKVHGARDSSWMTTTKLILPELKIKKFKGLQYGELRGLWELVNDYMGGPFVSRSYIDAKKRRIVTVEGYVYAPRFEKRDYVRRVLGIINTFSFDDNTKTEGENEKSENN